MLGPVRNDDDVNLAETNSWADFDFDYVLLKQSAKQQFFPQTDLISSYDGQGSHHDVDVSGKKTVLFGLRPCDARALVILDPVFGGEDEDPFYLSRRADTVIVTLACSDVLDTCFCTSLGEGPFSPEGSDILVTDLEDRYLFEPVSEKGGQFLGEFASHFRQAAEKETETREKMAAESVRKLSKMDTEGIGDRLADILESGYWDKAYRTCLACGSCTFLCPTCHCFAFYEKPGAEGGNRYRCWDSCQFPGYALEASGHNPRSLGKDRVHNRFKHKFEYFIKNFNKIACVGCGRCILHCPVNIDLRELFK